MASRYHNAPKTLLRAPGTEILPSPEKMGSVFHDDSHVTFTLRKRERSLHAIGKEALLGNNATTVRGGMKPPDGVFK